MILSTITSFITLLFLLCGVRGDFIASVRLEKFCDSDGKLLNGQHCDQNNLFGPNCDLELQLCLDYAYQTNVNYCSTGWIYTGLLAYDKNCDYFSSGKYYGKWPNPKNALFTGQYHGFNLKVIAKDYNFGQGPDAVVDKFVYTVRDQPDQISHRHDYFHRRLNNLRSTELVFDVTVTCVTGSPPDCGNSFPTTGYPFYQTTYNYGGVTSFPNVFPTFSQQPFFPTAGVSVSQQPFNGLCSGYTGAPPVTSYTQIFGSTTGSSFAEEKKEEKEEEKKTKEAVPAVPGNCPCGVRQRYSYDFPGQATPLYLVSPNYPNNYCNGVTCLWQLTSYYNYNVKLQFCTFNTESPYDKVRVYGGAGTNPANLIETCSGTYCGAATSQGYGNTLTVTFSSDGSVTRPGFLAAWEVIN